jgi:pathogenesis-related protein 1
VTTPIQARLSTVCCALLLAAACTGDDFSISGFTGDAGGSGGAVNGGAAPANPLGDDDGDGVPNGKEGLLDANMNGVPAYQDPAETTVNFVNGDGFTATTSVTGTATAGTLTTGVTPGMTDAGGLLDARMDMDTDAASTEPDAAAPVPGETGRLVGITAAHNAVRKSVSPGDPLPDLEWDEGLAAYAQDWADTIAADCDLRHSSVPGNQGENISFFGPADSSTAEQTVQGWAGEVDCYTYGTFGGTDACDMACTAAMNSNGCGHYTQIVWRDTTKVGCGVATSNSCDGFISTADFWVCSYGPAGNLVGFPAVAPY